MKESLIRNFVIIAHIDHGKSTLADRLLEATNTIEKRKMKEQVLDQMELEREKGITIKMQPVRMSYTQHSAHYILNLIDTPGHIDFSYEVSRALKAVEGAVLLVDATQGVQAQTITNVELAKEAGLVIIPVVNKIDLSSADVEGTKTEIMKLVNCNKEDILSVSAKTGAGVGGLLEKIVEKVPAPKEDNNGLLQALVFDFSYSQHRGVTVYARLVNGQVKAGDDLIFAGSGQRFTASEVGIFHPAEEARKNLSSGEIGYIVTSIKKPNVATVGDTITAFLKPASPLPGYMQPKPVVWASVYPVSADDFVAMKKALDVLHLSDSSLAYEEETSGALGRGFRCGFLGMLHLEIILERLKREFSLNLVTASPTITYKIELTNGEKIEIYSPPLFPEDHNIKKIYEPWIEARIITPPEGIGSIMALLYDHEAEVLSTDQFGGSRMVIEVLMPLRELMRGFFEALKSISAGYASLSYKIVGDREVPHGAITRLDILVAEEPVPAFSRIVSKSRIEREAESSVEKLKDLIPRALFVIKVQAKGLGRIIASRSISALKKDVTGHLYGGDRTRKMKLWEKQKKGKARMKASGKVEIPNDVFIKMMQDQN